MIPKEEATSIIKPRSLPTSTKRCMTWMTKDGKTTTQLDPVGGSETFQEGWQSGSGMV